MTNHSPENTQFFLTTSMPCPYLPARKERKLFTHLSGRRAQILHQVLSDHGFRRSQNLIYRPACEGCDACKSVRIDARNFQMSARHRRNMRANQDVVGTEVAPHVTTEQYELFKSYLEQRHEGGGMTQMTFLDYEYMVEDTPVATKLVEYRLRAPDGIQGELLAVALVDHMPDGPSMVYSFYNPALKKRGLGNFMILDHVQRARATSMHYVYLGYWVKDSPKMAYKADFRPLEIQEGSTGWHRIVPSEASGTRP